MYWDNEYLDKLIRFPIEGNAAELGSAIHFVAKADLNSTEVMEEINEELRANGFDYAPIRPYRERTYYDVQSEEVLSIADEQYVRYKEVMLYCINILTEFPFAMIVHPDKASWKIATRADLNTRTAKEYLYSYYSETARAVSGLIESKYNADEIQEIYSDVRSGGHAIDYWEKASAGDVDLHPVEFMSMADLKEVVAGVKSLRDELEFPSKTKCREAFDLVEKYRNKTMHGYRTMILDKNDVIELAESLEIASEMTVQAGGDEPGFEIPP
ncbi:hypothetical protein EXE49_07920 [Halorubrum sp. ASP121]|uniref:hypothetical protein n=1 Tax=Halorubrum sp. ASP121 TaxID=1855858 RepID=UPI0010F692A3|nr:hypothetical protein [Halorubrum sp. ASP121]TKX50088.1 hypothetical protein EXE49_07920 [Halorubrum sp. ASP121]